MIPNLKDWTTSESKNYDDLAEVYRELTAYWRNYLRHVVPNIGGIYENAKTADQEGFVYESVPETIQKNAMNFLLEQAFKTPEWLLEENILKNIAHAGAIESIRRQQVSILNQLLDFGRMQRLIETEELENGNSYTLLEMMTDLRNGLFSEVTKGQQSDAFRRNLQRGFIERMEFLMTENPSIRDTRRGQTAVMVSQSDIRAIVRGELNKLNRTLKNNAYRSNLVNQYHVQDLSKRIEKILDTDND